MGSIGADSTECPGLWGSRRFLFSLLLLLFLIFVLWESREQASKNKARLATGWAFLVLTERHFPFPERILGQTYYLAYICMLMDDGRVDWCWFLLTLFCMALHGVA